MDYFELFSIELLHSGKVRMFFLIFVQYCLREVSQSQG